MELQGHKTPPQLLEIWRRHHAPTKNVNNQFQQGLSPLDKLAAAITSKVGSMGFFFIILAWTILWCGYNILASEVPALHWKAFDPFPAFVAYLLMSNVIQILLMPLIMVGQEVQGRHSEMRAENDFEINQKAEQEVEMLLYQLQYQQHLLLALAQTQGLKMQELIQQVEAAIGPPPAPKPVQKD